MGSGASCPQVSRGSRAQRRHDQGHHHELYDRRSGLNPRLSATSTPINRTAIASSSRKSSIAGHSRGGRNFRSDWPFRSSRVEPRRSAAGIEQSDSVGGRVRRRRRRFMSAAIMRNGGSNNTVTTKTNGESQGGIMEPTLTSLIFLGTGTSSQVPAIGCLTDPKTPCKVCPSSLHPATQKNRRRNTSALLTLSNGKTILIDCGKSFFDAALQIWPRATHPLNQPDHEEQGLRRIDALLLTHAHADAINGLDDLRGWTLGGFIQSSIPIYCSQTTFEAVRNTFPYMVDVSRATGGGDIPAFVWHIIPEYGDFFVSEANISIKALAVVHGVSFSSDGQGGATAALPFMCLGFKVGKSELVYISDASHIPDDVRDDIKGVKCAVLDGLKWGPHASHMSIPETLDFVNQLARDGAAPGRTYLVDFTHEIDHYEFEKHLRETQSLDIRPAYDGLQVRFGQGDAGLSEKDLLGDRALVAVCELRGSRSRPNIGQSRVENMI